MQVKSANNHRNGISGTPFTVAIVNDAFGEGEDCDYLVITTGDDAADTFVLTLDQIANGDTESAWRGDRAAAACRDAIREAARYQPKAVPVTKIVQAHYPVVVPLTVEVDEDGNTVRVVETGTPYVDPEVSINFDNGDVWDPTVEEWRTTSEVEYDAGTERLGTFANGGESETALSALNEAFTSGYKEGDGDVGLTFDDDPESLRSRAYDYGRTLYRIEHGLEDSIHPHTTTLDEIAKWLDSENIEDRDYAFSKIEEIVRSTGRIA